MTEDSMPSIDPQEFRKAVTTRRSVRQFTSEPIPEDVLQDCLDLALMAPNSSNLQMWNFYRVTTPEKREALIKACMSQKAAKTAAELIVCTGHTRNWRQHAKDILAQWPGEPPKVVRQYYGGLAAPLLGQKINPNADLEVVPGIQRLEKLRGLGQAPSSTNRICINQHL